MVLVPAVVYWWVAVLVELKGVSHVPLLSQSHRTLRADVGSSASVQPEASTANRVLVSPVVRSTVKAA